MKCQYRDMKLFIVLFLRLFPALLMNVIEHNKNLKSAEENVIQRLKKVKIYKKLIV